MRRDQIERKTLKRCDELADLILTIWWEEDRSYEERAKQLIGLFGPKDGDAFFILDSYPGLFYGHMAWHYKLRQVRNHPHWGQLLFKQWSPD